MNYFPKIINFQEQNTRNFLIESGSTAPVFEKNIAEQEKEGNF